MKNYPYTIDNGHGEQVTFTGTTRSPGGERLVGEGVAQPGAGAPMHVHYLQEEAVQVTGGRLGHQILGQELQFAGPGELVVWPAGTVHRWWNADNAVLRTTGWVSPPINFAFYLDTLFASAKQSGNGRPGLFDVAFLMTRYRNEHATLGVPTVVRRVVLPMLYVVGLAIGKYRKYVDAPRPMPAESQGASSVAPAAR
jgi:quercetin dioxygenase-like cupin family protein